LGKDTDLFTQAEYLLHIQPLSKLAEPRIISTTILEGRLRLTLAWAEITTLVTSYKLLTREYGQTCKNEKCPNYRCSLQGKTCPSCKRPLKSAEVTKVKEEIQFEQPYRTHYQAPVVKIEINPPLIAALQTQMSKIKEHLRTTHDNNIPEPFKDLWTHSPEFIALHSMEHQLIKAVPLVILSSSLDVDAFIDNPQGRTIGWLFDSCDGGTGTAEALFQNLPKFAAKARALALSCDCSSGCPRCLTQHGCPQENTGLHKDAGLILLDAI
jgi:DEAD/DEAH box helicase domain-containing protein